MTWASQDWVSGTFVNSSPADPILAEQTRLTRRESREIRPDCYIRGSRCRGRRPQTTIGSYRRRGRLSAPRG
ncbi:hypothetical protein GCM10009637_13220 [Brevibacterium luteolum]